MQVSTSLQTDNHANTSPLSFLQAGCPSCHPTDSVKALRDLRELHYLLPNSNAITDDSNDMWTVKLYQTKSYLQMYNGHKTVVIKLLTIIITTQ